MRDEFFRTIRAQIQDSWGRLIWQLLAILLAGVPCAFRYIYDFRYFSCPNSFRADHNKQKLAEAEYHNNNNKNSNNLLEFKIIYGYSSDKNTSDVTLKS